mmetsp:Transcript_14119/g.10180  ORF Transcript_14119/g.10180 Transcript_14119/m.10180 type:complete len:88 (+) Transcript_14119:62-325(+)|eukprot:CAMPEP_0202963452 /NCGR_PEP_ID=MMETSP1396-20130829/7438_1 /ASSEMBLY_ACC=CAM_ASM_000872 /TAXON_ID= /ORGANISM="Pseudokeronopsis sp., Strain Brazil" /LENGTH=87 /DNA_ID=CAMNT_0049684663 /DNA_START=56 /DNA_END=319 /DNA_ORIENTATION=-
MRKCEKYIYQVQVRPESEKLAMDLSKNLESLGKLSEKFYPAKDGKHWFKEAKFGTIVKEDVREMLCNSESNKENIELLKKYNAGSLK